MYPSEIKSSAGKRVAFFVMPTGHGKTHQHSPERGIYDAATIVPPSGTAFLRFARDHGKKTGKWDTYDREWTRLLVEYVESTIGNIVVMIPHYANGIRVGWVDMGGAILTRKALEHNFRERKDNLESYEYYRMVEKRRGAPEFESNKELEKCLLLTAERWIVRGIDEPSRIPYLLDY
jgi:hypothetical protein